MRSTADTETDRAAEIAPEITHTVPWRLTSVVALPNARLRVNFVDSTAGEVDMLVLLSDPKIDGTIFEALRDPAVFGQARVVMGAVEWPNGADLAPDAMYDAIKETGVWVLE